MDNLCIDPLRSRRFPVSIEVARLIYVANARSSAQPEDLAGIMISTGYTTYPRSCANIHSSQKDKFLY